MQSQSHVCPIILCDRPCCTQATTPQIEFRAEIDNANILSAKRDTEANRILDEAREVERRMRLDMERWNEERRVEIKGMREEQLKWLWDSKVKQKRYFLGFGPWGKKE